MTSEQHRDRWQALARLKRPWCWLAGHDWEGKPKSITFSQCARCGKVEPAWKVNLGYV